VLQTDLRTDGLTDGQSANHKSPPVKPVWTIKVLSDTTISKHLYYIMETVLRVVYMYHHLDFRPDLDLDFLFHLDHEFDLDFLVHVLKSK